MVFGGMPEVVLAGQHIKNDIIRNYYNTLIRRDIIEKYRIRGEVILKDLIKLLINSTHYTGSKLFNTLKSIGHSVGKSTVLKYVSYLCDSFFMDDLMEFSPKIKDQLQRQRKTYFIDNAFIAILTTRIHMKGGRLFENLIYWHLKQTYKDIDICYFRGDKDEEVDFVLLDSPKKLIQVAYDMQGISTAEREIRALVKAGRKFALSEALVITYDQEKQDSVKWFKNEMRVHLIPAWKYLLGLH
ncbi:MAG: hypothetical protein A2Y62_13830 [Candidatus Fischerbacteria bacterium RBG_13_37_8]|uniref:DUF4143 domain-containing protein n=1 Tax=Candidatus Fischerbacteria bacterium RBG_13_37_8 TaxID=1817863 RepID=A0A1F5VXL4_9BACT|nr:MAG: hypothetical protein A2Y62_13830 [Candidatus Fischerbacteria bacterium RBG_13_37_8]